MRRQLLPCLAAALALAAAARGGTLSVAAAPAPGSGIEVSWTFWEAYGQPPVARPEWVGYDVYRRAPATCSDWARLNPEIVPRVVGVTHSCRWLDAAAAAGAAYEYRVLPVDAARALVPLGVAECDPPCSPPAQASWPALSAPLVVGTVTEWGWAVLLTPCANTCWSQFYVENPAAEALRPYAGSGQAVRVFGTATCGTMEGCALQLDHFDLDACGSTPARRGSWGALKSVYR